LWRTLEVEKLLDQLRGPSNNEVAEN
jgi:hypothetical protein